MTRDALRELPNIISLSRIGLAALFIVLPDRSVRIALVLAAAGSDFLDGWLARRRHLASRWGALIDPIADRFFVFTAICALLFDGALSTTQYFILIARDLATAVGFLVARVVPWLRAVTFQARWSGKTVTVLQFVTLLAILARSPGTDALIVLVGVTSAWAIADYTLALWRARAS